MTHGQHGPAEGLTILTYAVSEVSHHGEPMDWVRNYGKGRVYVTMCCYVLPSSFGSG